MRDKELIKGVINQIDTLLSKEEYKEFIRNSMKLINFNFINKVLILNKDLSATGVHEYNSDLDINCKQCEILVPKMVNCYKIKESDRLIKRGEVTKEELTEMINNNTVEKIRKRKGNIVINVTIDTNKSVELSIEERIKGMLTVLKSELQDNINYTSIDYAIDMYSKAKAEQLTDGYESKIISENISGKFKVTQHDIVLTEESIKYALKSWVGIECDYVGEASDNITEQLNSESSKYMLVNVLSYICESIDKVLEATQKEIHPETHLNGEDSIDIKEELMDKYLSLMESTMVRVKTLKGTV